MDLRTERKKRIQAALLLSAWIQINHKKNHSYSLKLAKRYIRINYGYPLPKVIL